MFNKKNIRSFQKLIEMEQPNPYTRDPIPSNVIKRAKKLTGKFGIPIYILKFIHFRLKLDL